MIVCLLVSNRVETVVVEVIGCDVVVWFVDVDEVAVDEVTNVEDDAGIVVVSLGKVVVDIVG